MENKKKNFNLTVRLDKGNRSAAVSLQSKLVSDYDYTDTDIRLTLYLKRKDSYI